MDRDDGALRRGSERMLDALRGCVVPHRRRWEGTQWRYTEWTEDREHLVHPMATRLPRVHLHLREPRAERFAQLRSIKADAPCSSETGQLCGALEIALQLKGDVVGSRREFAPEGLQAFERLEWMTRPAFESTARIDDQLVDPRVPAQEIRAAVFDQPSDLRRRMCGAQRTQDR